MNKEEAIKVLNARPYTGEVREALETLIPELKESEGERIRKTLINALKTTKSVGELKFVLPEPIREECITYLEKQKEQKPTQKFRVGDMIISTKNPHLTYKILEVGHINELGNPEYKVEIFEDGKPGIMDKPHNIHYMECHKVDEWGKLIEQKPAEWSEEDEIYLQDALWCVKQASKVARGENDMGACWSAERWLKSLPERLNLQPNCPQNKIHYWTEEEIEPIVSDYLTGREHYGGMMARLRCLKPKSHWKPSEEQMEALRKVAYKMGNACLGKGFANDENLHSLYVALKKLM